MLSDNLKGINILYVDFNNYESKIVRKQICSRRHYDSAIELAFKYRPQQYCYRFLAMYQ